jgi:putative acetyltransferase
MNIQIINYEDRYAADFKRLNMEWLDKYQLAEGHDLEILDDPRGTVIDSGGIIFLVKAGEEIIGTAGLMKEAEGVYELIKMAVADGWKGKGIGKMLMDKCLATARDWKIQKVTLFSNSQLKTAIDMYKKYGFQHISTENSPYVTADVRMELELGIHH